MTVSCCLCSWSTYPISNKKDTVYMIVAYNIINNNISWRRPWQSGQSPLKAVGSKLARAFKFFMGGTCLAWLRNVAGSTQVSTRVWNNARRGTWTIVIIPFIATISHFSCNVNMAVSPYLITIIYLKIAIFLKLAWTKTAIE